MSPAQGLKAVVESLGLVGGSTGWKGIVSGLRSESNIAAFIDSGGRGGEVKVAIDYPTVQVLVKGDQGEGGYLGAYGKGRAIYDGLLGIDTPDGSWPYLVSCVAINQPLYIGKDDGGRPIFSLNFQLIVTPEAAGNRTY